MIKYQVRSRDLIDMVNDVRTGRLILSPYFQRNLVWRELHKKDFIETILRGYPFPQVFVARGDINVDTMTSQSCVVDGQQRMNSIIEFVNDGFPVAGRKFSTLDVGEKEDFLKYQVPVIDLEMKATDPSVIDVFKRLNRTFYSLSTIEKMATEYSSVDFMLLGKYLCGAFSRLNEEDEGVELAQDPNLPPEFLPWARMIDVSDYTRLVTDSDIFSGYENTRMVHLMWTLNLLSTVRFGLFARNDKTKEMLELAEQEVPGREKLLILSQRVAQLFFSLDLPRVPWWGKSNSFSFLIIAYWHLNELEQMGVSTIKDKLEKFGNNLPQEYILAAREAVNNLKERRIRHQHLTEALGLAPDEFPLERY